MSSGDVIDLTESGDECSSTDVESENELPELAAVIPPQRDNGYNVNGRSTLNSGVCGSSEDSQPAEKRKAPSSFAGDYVSNEYFGTVRLPEGERDDPMIPSRQDSLQSSQSTENSQSSYSYASSSTTCSQSSRGTKNTDEARRLKAEERERKKREKEEEKMRKQREKEMIKERKAAEKAGKANQRAMLKSQKPGECMKYICVIMEESLVQSAIGAKLLTMLQDSEVRYRFEKFSIDKLIVWQRETPADSQGSHEDPPEEQDVAIIVSLDQFVEYIHSSVNNTTEGIDLALYIDQLKDNLPGKRLTVIVPGMEKYFRDVKTLNQRQYRQNVVEASGNSEGVKKGTKKLKVSHVVTRLELEQCLVEMEVSTTVNFKFPETDEEMAKLVFGMTKAIAEAPFKRNKNEVEFSFLPENKNVVKVGKDGQGLSKLWTNQLLQFNNVSPDIANAITSQFPSPLSLCQAYASAPSEREAELMLADIRVRRGAGVLETSRRIGKELSRRIYELMTKDDPDHLLH